MTDKKRLLVVVPCYNEELVLEKTISAIFEYATRYLNNYEWDILIVDNNSKDRTWDIAKGLAKNNKFVGKVIADQVRVPARGTALKTVFMKYNSYDIYSYMDADLATDIKDFLFIVDKVDEGYDLVTGSRYLSHSDVRRTFKRKFLSKVYNIIIRLVLKANFRDAQCGFKAFSKKIVTELVPKTEDPGWFWDTELMIYASRHGYKVLEVPVSWREIRDELRVSTVSVYSEVIRNLKNINLMRKKVEQWT